MLKKLAIVSLGTMVLGQGALFGVAMYEYPELRKNKRQLLGAVRRGMRCSTTGAMMAWDYYSDPDYSHATHERASQRLYDCFTKNGGPYIKMGQMIAQMGQLVPVEYSTRFDSLCTAAPQTDYEDVV
jgi:predicted unusual protein kinase regulating ubiquinone biosynthesis (AarF/ABC1/UbiB family)